MSVNQDARQDPLFDEVRMMILETRKPSISLTQRTFRIKYTRAANLLKALEGDIVTPRDEHGLRKMLTGETLDYLNDDTVLTANGQLISLPVAFMKVKDITPEAMQRLKFNQINPGVVSGIATGFSSLDYYTFGLQRGNLIIVAGRPSMGKRDLVRNIALHVALKNKLPVAMLDNRMGSQAQLIRLIASSTKIGLRNLRSGQINENDMQRVESFAKILIEAPLYFSTLNPLTVHELGDQLRQLSHTTGEMGLVVVDCLTELKISAEKIDATMLAYKTGYLKSLAQELNVPIILISPINCDIEERDNKRPTLMDLPGMSAIDHAADLVLIVYRDEVYDIASEQTGTAEILISKNLSGCIGSITLKFDGHCGVFEEMHYE